MTEHNPNDCFLTPPCAAYAINGWLQEHDAGILDHWLDPFAGPGTLLVWGAPSALGMGLHAFELDARWERELRTRISPLSIRVGRDSFQMEWLVWGPVKPHVLSNPPFGSIRLAVEMALDHAREHQRWACLLVRTDWWQHAGRSHLRPDHMLMLEWRPVFGLNRHGKFGTDYAGYAWCVWSPTPSGECRMEWLARPEDVPKEMVAEHRRLARLAHEMGRQALGA